MTDQCYGLVDITDIGFCMSNVNQAWVVKDNGVIYRRNRTTAVVSGTVIATLKTEGLRTTGRNLKSAAELHTDLEARENWPPPELCQYREKCVLQEQGCDVADNGDDDVDEDEFSSMSHPVVNVEIAMWEGYIKYRDRGQCVFCRCKEIRKLRSHRLFDEDVHTPIEDMAIMKVVWAADYYGERNGILLCADCNDAFTAHLCYVHVEEVEGQLAHTIKCVDHRTCGESWAHLQKLQGKRIELPTDPETREYWPPPELFQYREVCALHEQGCNVADNSYDADEDELSSVSHSVVNVEVAMWEGYIKYRDRGVCVFCGCAELDNLRAHRLYDEDMHTPIEDMAIMKVVWAADYYGGRNGILLCADCSHAFTTHQCYAHVEEVDGEFIHTVACVDRRTCGESWSWAHLKKLQGKRIELPTDPKDLRCWPPPELFQYHEVCALQEQEGVIADDGDDADEDELSSMSHSVVNVEAAMWEGYIKYRDREVCVFCGCAELDNLRAHRLYDEDVHTPIEDMAIMKVVWAADYYGERNGILLCADCNDAFTAHLCYVHVEEVEGQLAHTIKCVDRRTCGESWSLTHLQKLPGKRIELPTDPKTREYWPPPELFRYHEAQAMQIYALSLEKAPHPFSASNIYWSNGVVWSTGIVKDSCGAANHAGWSKWDDDISTVSDGTANTADVSWAGYIAQRDRGRCVFCGCKERRNLVPYRLFNQHSSPPIDDASIMKVLWHLRYYDGHNGILLCADCNDAFTAHLCYVRVEEVEGQLTHTIKCVDRRTCRESWSWAHLQKLQDKRVEVPTDPDDRRNWPPPELFQYHEVCALSKVPCANRK